MDSFLPDILSYPDRNNEGTETAFAEATPSQDSYFLRRGVYPDSNSDLNSFFPRTGLTPLGTPGIGLFGAFQSLSWGENEQEILNLGEIPMPQDIIPQQIEAQITVDPNAMDWNAGSTSEGKKQELNGLVKQDNGNDSTEVQKPKRGRPRKKRDKKHLSLQEENAKRQRFLERNRLAARKCRDRKKNWTQDTMDKLAQEERKHVELQLEYNRLHGEAASLMEAACEHLGRCGDKAASFHESLSLLSDHIADIGRVYLSMGGYRGQDEQPDGEDEESVSMANSDELSHNHSHSESGRTASVVDSIQDCEDFGDPAVGQSSPMSRQGSSNSYRSIGDSDSAICTRDSPIKPKFHPPADEGFFSSEDGKPASTTTHHHSMPVVIMPNPCISYGNA